MVAVTRPVTVRGVTLGDGNTRVIVPLTAATPDALLAEAATVAAAGPDLVEWRIDPLLAAGHDLTVAVALRAALGKLPLLVTLRTAAEGGQFEVTDPDYLDLVRGALNTGVVDLLDVELARATGTAAVRAAHEVQVPVVMSEHHFDGTPAESELVAALDRMLAADADVAKIAVMPNSPADVLTLLSATATVHARTDRPIISMAMGQLGAVSRIGGGVFGSAATFATVGAASAPGQLPLAEVRAALGLVEGRSVDRPLSV